MSTKQRQLTPKHCPLAEHPFEAVFQTLIFLLQDEALGKGQSLQLEKAYFAERSRFLRSRLKDPHKLAQARELLQLAYRWRLTAEALLRPCLKQALSKLDFPLRSGLWLAVCEIFWRPQAKAAQVVNTAVTLVRTYAHQGQASVANAVLRRLVREKDRRMAALTTAEKVGLAEPSYLLLEQRWGKDKLHAFLSSLMLEKPLAIRARVADLPQHLPPDQVQWQAGRLLPSAFLLQLQQTTLNELEAFRQGAFYIQGEAAQLPISLLPIQADDCILDLCAAPGGKAIQAADVLQQLHGKGYVLALDQSPERLERLRENQRRLKVAKLYVACHDAREQLAFSELQVCLGEHEAKRRLQERWDIVVADVPCSAIGRWQQHPEGCWQNLSEVESSLLPLQAEILKQASRHTKEGGYLLYATCTLNPRENQQQISCFLNSKEGESFHLIDLTDKIQAITSPEAKLSQAIQEKGMLTLWPDCHLSEGFFLAVLQKASI